MIDLTMLVRGIPLYDWFLMAGVLMALIGLQVWLLERRQRGPGRRTTTGGNPTRKRSWLP